MLATLFASAGTTFIQTLVKALALGSVYIIMGLGFVIIFKGTQVLNFAAGALSMAGALLGIGKRTKKLRVKLGV